MIGLFSLRLHWPSADVKGETSNKLVIGWIAVIVNTFVSATYNIFAKMLTGGLSPFTLLFVSEILTLLFTFLLFGSLPLLRQLFSIKKSQLIPLICIGITNGVLGPLCIFTGLHYTTAVNATLFSNAETVFVVFFAIVILRELWTWAHILSAITIFFGIVIISLEGFEHGLELHLGDMLILFGSFCFSTGSIVFRRYLHHTNPHLAIVTRSLVAITAFFLISPFLPTPLIKEIWVFPLVLVPVLIGFAFISRFMNILTFYHSIERLPISTVSLVTNMNVIVGIVMAHYFLNEGIFGYHWIGGSFIIAGTILLEVLGVHPSEEHLENHLIEKRPSRV